MGIIAKQLSVRLQYHLGDIEDLNRMITDAIDHVEKLNSDNHCEFLSAKEIDSMRKGQERVMKITQKLSDRADYYRTNFPSVR